MCWSCGQDGEAQASDFCLPTKSVTLGTEKGDRIPVSTLSALATDLSPQCFTPTKSTVSNYSLYKVINGDYSCSKSGVQLVHSLTALVKI